MKHLLISLLLLQTAMSYADGKNEDRQVLEVEGMRLSPFWAQEYIGADLVKKKMRNRHDLERIPFAIFDVGFEEQFVNRTLDIPVDFGMNGRRRITAHHGTSVANNINGHGHMGVSEIVDYVQLAKVSPSVFYFGAVSSLKRLEVRPMIISNSVGWSGDLIKDLASEIDDMGIIWVLAAGNDYPSEMAVYEREAPVIKVGSYSPFGQQTIYSQESEQLTIMAPADEYLASLDGKGEKVLFGATSGATPLVSGMIANVKSLIPSLTRLQIEKLIQKTAIKSINFHYRKIKTGLFNGLKFYEAVSLIKSKCGIENDSCVEGEIEKLNDDTFSQRYSHENADRFCSGDRGDLSDQELDKLREDVMLKPSDKILPRLLACVYNKMDLTLNGDYYENIYLTYHNPEKLMKKITQRAKNAAISKFENSSSLRDVELFDEEMIDLLNDIALKDYGIGSYRAKELLERITQEL